MRCDQRPRVARRRVSTDATPRGFPRRAGGHNRATRLIGSGGMGAVYEARNTWSDHRVALKVLQAEHARSREMVSRLLTEARAASAIRPPKLADRWPYVAAARGAAIRQQRADPAAGACRGRE